MMKLRLFMLALVAMISAGTTRAADVDPLWPAEATQVFKLNIKQVLESDLIKKYALAQLKQAMEGKDAQKTMKELGIDPLKDVDTLSGGMWGDDPKDITGVVVLRGKFDSGKLFEAVEKAAQKDGDKISIVKEGDLKLVKIVNDDMPKPIYATMADDKTIVVSNEKKLLLGAVKAHDSKAKPAIKDELAALVKDQDDKATMFFAGLASGKVGDIPPNPIFDDVEKLKKQIEQMQSSSMTLRVTGDVSIEMMMHMKSTEAADDFGTTVKELLDKARVFLPILAMQAPQAKSIVDDLKKMSSKVDGKNVKMSMKVTGDAIGKAVGAEE